MRTWFLNRDEEKIRFSNLLTNGCLELRIYLPEEEEEAKEPVIHAAGSLLNLSFNCCDFEIDQ
jgi:hypothetical protein